MGNIYTFEILLDGKDIYKDSIAFSFIDSIYSILNRATLSVPDVSFLYYNKFGFHEGKEVKISISQNNLPILSSTFVIKNDFWNDIGESNELVNTDINLVNSWILSQRTSTMSYTDRVSPIVQILISDYFSPPFYYISDTSTLSTFYQANKTQMSFIQDVLLPYSSSPNAENSPFYCFINSKNVFNFVHFPHMYTTPKHTYIVGSLPADVPLENYVISYKRFSLNYVDFLKNAKFSVWSIDQYGVQTKQSYNMVDSYVPSQKSLPVVEKFVPVPDQDIYTYYLEINQDSSDLSLTNLNKARYNYLFKDVFSVNRFMIIVPFNPYLVSGDIIELLFNGPNSDKLKGSYIVEMSEHIVDAVKNTFITRLIVFQHFSSISSAKAQEAKFITKLV